MKPFIAVVTSASGKIAKHQDFDTQAEADVHVITFGGFVASSPGPHATYWIVDDVAKTLTYDNAQEAADAAVNANGPRLREIDGRLSEIDSSSIRSMRAKSRGVDGQADRGALDALDAEAATLRAERAGL